MSVIRRGWSILRVGGVSNGIRKECSLLNNDCVLEVSPLYN